MKTKAKIGVLRSLDAIKIDPEQPVRPAKLVYFDNTDLHLCPKVGPSYQPQGQQKKVETPGKDNFWYALFGALIYPSGEGLYTIHQLKRHQEIQAHLQALLDSMSDVK